MAIMVYVLATGAAQSYIPDNVTIAQAQASGQLASNATLAANGFGAAQITALSPTNVWNPATLTTVTATAPTVAAPMPTFFFIARFTAAEWAGLQIASATDQTVQQFLDALATTSITDLTEPLLQQFGTYAIGKSYLTSARAQTILTTPYVPTSKMG